MQAFSSQSSLQRGREEEEGKTAQSLKPKRGWPESRVGRQSDCLQTCSLPSTEAGLVKITAVGSRWSSYHSLSKRLGFLPPLLSTDYKWMVHGETRPGLVLPALAWRVGRGRGRATHTNTYSGQSCFSGAGPGCWWVPWVLGQQGRCTGVSSRHNGAMISPPQVGLVPPPQTTLGGRSPVGRLNNSPALSDTATSTGADTCAIYITPLHCDTASTIIAVSQTKRKGPGNRSHG